MPSDYVYNRTHYPFIRYRAGVRPLPKKRKNDPFATNLRCFYGTIHNVDVMTSPTNLSVAVIVLSVTRKHEYHLAQRTY